MENHELVKEAVQFLLASGQADRIGVWIEASEPNGFASHGLSGFRGIVADRDGESTPAEWELLSPEAPLPAAVLNDRNSVEQDLEGSSSPLVFGALVDIRRAVWVPVESRGRLRGVMLAGLRTRHGVLPTALLEAVSAELALAIELDGERRKARERQADLAEVARALAELAASGPSDAMLANLMSNCTDAGAAGLGAVFAFLRADENSAGGLPCECSAHEDSGNGERPGPEKMEAGERRAVSWPGGDPAWIHAFESQPLSFIWERAHQARGTITIAAGGGVTWPHGDVARIVAIPLRAAGEKAGMLIAGFRNESLSPATIERLESRAGVATAALTLRATTTKQSCTARAAAGQRRRNHFSGCSRADCGHEPWGSRVAGRNSEAGRRAPARERTSAATISGAVSRARTAAFGGVAAPRVRFRRE
jgi:hypothetical protein